MSKEDKFKDRSLHNAFQEVLHYARLIAYIDDAKVVGADDLFRQMQRLSIKLSGLKHAVKTYDATLEFFEEEEKDE